MISRICLPIVLGIICFAQSASGQLANSPWPMERHDRWGTSRAPVGPPTWSTPWISANLCVSYPVSHGPSLGPDSIAFVGDWVENSVVKFNTKTLQVYGSFNALNFVACTPALCDWSNIVFSTDSPSGRVFSIDSAIMDFNWFTNTGYVGGSPMIGPDGDVVAANYDGIAYRWHPASGDIVWSHSGLGQAFGSSVFTRDDTKIVIANGTHLTALYYDTGNLAWDVNLSSTVGAPGVAPDGKIVVGLNSGSIKAINPDTGATVWTKSTLDKVTAAPAFDNSGNVYIGSYDWRLYAFKTSDGTRLWSYTTTHWIEYAALVGHDGRIYVHNKYGDLYCLNSSGTLVWTLPLVGEARGPMSMDVDGTLYVGRTADDDRYRGLAIIRQQPAHVTGKITFGDYLSSAAKPECKFVLRIKGSSTDIAAVNATPDASGNYAVDFPISFAKDGYGANGQYVMLVKPAHWLRKAIEIDLKGGSQSGVDLTLVNGDITGDNKIDLLDWNALSSAWRSTPTSSNWNANADLNGDKAVNLLDWNILSKNWRKTGD